MGMKATLAVLVLVTAACGGSSGEASSCDGVARQGVELIQKVLDQLEGMTFAEVAALGDQQPAAFDELDADGEKLAAEAERLNCTEAELGQYVTDHAGDLKANGEVAELILGQIKSDPSSFLN